MFALLDPPIHRESLSHLWDSTMFVSTVVTSFSFMFISSKWWGFMSSTNVTKASGNCLNLRKKNGFDRWTGSYTICSVVPILNTIFLKIGRDHFFSINGMKDVEDDEHRKDIEIGEMSFAWKKKFIFYLWRRFEDGVLMIKISCNYDYIKVNEKIKGLKCVMF